MNFLIHISMKFKHHLRWRLQRTRSMVARPIHYVFNKLMVLTHFNFHLHPAYFSLHLALCNTLNVVRTINIARNWAVSTNLGRKIQSCSFCLKIGTNGILEELILHLDLDFRNFDPKILCWANLGRKHQSYPFCLKIGT